MRIIILGAAVPNTDVAKSKMRTYEWATEKQYRDRLLIMHPHELAKFKDIDLIHGRISGIAITDLASLQYAVQRWPNHKLYDHSTSPAHGSIEGASCVVADSVRLLVVPSIAMLNSSRQAKFAYGRLLQKITKPDNWIDQYRFDGTYVKSKEQFDSFKWALESAVFLSVDLETTRQLELKRSIAPDDTMTYSAAITVVGVTAAIADGNSWKFVTISWDFKNLWHHEALAYLADLPQAKLFKNGLYDNAYTTRWGTPMRNWTLDLEYFVRANFPDFAGRFDLGAVHALFCKDSMYWKDGIDATNWKDFHMYCQRDCHNTAEAFLAVLACMTPRVLRNYEMGFARTGMCVLSAMRGMKMNKDKRREFAYKYNDILKESAAFVELAFGCKYSQSDSILPVLQLWSKAAAKLKVKDVYTPKTTKDGEIASMATFHPLVEYALDKLGDARSAAAWLSTFINVKTWSVADNGEVPSPQDDEYFLWDVNPFRTTSQRLASNGSAFWVGSNGQNYARDLRSIMVPPDGHVFVSTDAPQSESRCSGYLSKCMSLIYTVEGENDFHADNTAFFFGRRYEDIYDNERGKTIDKPLRELGKRGNHGWTYNMGAGVMLTTMGVKNVRIARGAFGMSIDTKLVDVTKRIIAKADEKYPEVRSKWYKSQVVKVLTKGTLPCVTGFEPIVFGNPIDHKPDLNTVVSTEPQNLSAYISLKAAVKLVNAEIEGRAPKGFRYVLQMHDEQVCTAPASTPVKEMDDFLYEECANSTDMGWVRPDTGKPAVLVIPVGEPVYAKHWAGLKADAVRRKPDLTTIGDYT